MNNEHDSHVPLVHHHISPPSFLLCSALCIVSILVSFRQIKRYRSRRYHRGIRSHCAPLPPEEQTMASPDEMASRKHLQPEGQVVSKDAHDPHSSNQSQQIQVPSPTQACDILLPLSHFVPVPASGHVAALAREAARGGGKPSPMLKSNLECLPFAPEQGKANHPPVPLPPQQTSSDYSAESVDPQPHCHPIENSSPSRPLVSSNSHQAHHQSPFDVVGGSGASGTGVAMQPGPAEGHHPVPRLSSPGANEMQSVQKRSETVHFCREVDAEGIRFWRRLIVEYS